MMRVLKSFLTIVLPLACALPALAAGSRWTPVGPSTHVQGGVWGNAVLEADTGDGPVLVWNEYDPETGGTRIEGGRLADDLSVASRDLGLPGYYALALAVGPNHALLVVWSWTNSTTLAIVTDFDGNEIARVNLGDEPSAAAAWDGAAFTIALLDEVDVRVARLTDEGDVLWLPSPLVDNVRTHGVPLDPRGTMHLVPLGDQLLLVWQEGDIQTPCYITCPPPPPPGIIRTARLRNGQLVEGSLHDFFGATPYFAPTVAVGDSIAITWLQQTESYAWDADLRVEFLDTDLEEIRSIVVPMVTDMRSSYARLSTLWRNGELLVAWDMTNESADTGTKMIEMAEIDPTGDPRVSTLVASTADASLPRLVPWTDGFLLVFDEDGLDFAIQRYRPVTIARRRGVKP